MQITVTIDVDSFDDIPEYDNKGTIQSLDDVDIEGLPDCLEDAVDAHARQGDWRTLRRLERFVSSNNGEKIAYMAHVHEQERSIEDAIEMAEKVRLIRISMETFTYDGTTYEVIKRG